MSKLSKLIYHPKLFFRDAWKKRFTKNLLTSIPGVTKQSIAKKQSNQIDIFNEVVELANHHNVNTIKIGLEYIWPYLRNHMWIHLNFFAIGKSQRDVNPLLVYGGHYSQFSKSYRRDVINNEQAIEIESIPEESNDFLFVFNVNGSEELIHDEKIYHRLTDPLLEAAQKLGKTKKIGFIKNGRVQILSMQYHHEAQLILPPTYYKTGYTHNLFLQQKIFKDRSEHAPSFLMTGNSLTSLIDHAMFTREYYLELLKRLSPKVICFYAFHYNAPLISAADELGILTVDLQHGLQVGWNPLYNNWDELPASGYQALPDYFAVWGEKEYNNILKTFHSKKHKPIYMGSPWLKKIEEFSNPLSPHIVNSLNKFDTKILIIMQNQKTIPKLFLDIIKNTNNDILWVIRHHPNCTPFTENDFKPNSIQNEAYESNDELALSLQNNILIDKEIDNILFNELFKHIDIAISEGSALALEATYFGVKNIITSEMGKENYKQEIEDGVFFYMEHADQFTDILNKINTNNMQKNNKYGFKDVDTKKFMAQLLEEAKKKKEKHNLAQKTKKKQNLPLLKLEETVENMFNLIEDNNIHAAVDIFYSVRKILNQTPNIKELYAYEQDIWKKEAKVFKRKIQNTFKHTENDIVIIGDSLQLPRPLETQASNYGIDKTTTYKMNKNGLKTITWGQRFLTTQKLIDNWDLMVEDIRDKHLVIHLGLNDCAPRIFLEEQRLSLREYPREVNSRIVDFGRVYRKEIIENQKEHCYVPFKDFKRNILSIATKAEEASVKSLTFINIINFLDSHEKDSPGSQQISKKYNKELLSLKKKYNFIDVINLNDIVHEIGFSECVLEDNMHLSHFGHEVLATKLEERIQLQCIQ